MAILSKGTDFSTGDQVTAAKLDALVDNATFASDAVDGSTTQIDGNGKIIVKDGGITPAKLNLVGANVGIGTNTPSSQLEVVGDILIDNGGSDGGQLLLASAGNNTMQIDNESGRFRVVNATAGTELLTVSSSGQIKSFGSTFANLQLIAGDNTSFSSIDFGDVNDENIQRIVGDHSNNSLEFFTNDTETARVYRSSSVPTVCRLSLGNNSNFNLAFNDASGNGGINGGSSDNNEILHFASTGKVIARGDLQAVGTLSKGGGTFIIDHPISEKKDTHYLAHSFIEGPQCDNIYRGKVSLTSGSATINLDTVSNMTEGTFTALNRDIQCFTSNETGWTAVKGSVSGNVLTINAQDGLSTDSISWMVIGERQDDTIKSLSMTDDNGNLIVEPLKES